MSATAEKTRGKSRGAARRAKRSAAAASSLPTHALAYALAIFLGSTLLFLLEPIAAKRLVPLLGGSAAVWTTCLVFFQTALLLGYYVAHLLVTHANLRTQVTAYVSLLALSGLQLVRVVNPTLVANPERPIASVLWLLAGLIGLPFVTLSATSPLLQSWFARTTPRGRSNAYGLFAISNFGSIVALLAYPWLIEPRLSLRAQTIVVAIVLGMLLAVAIVIGISVRKATDSESATTPTVSSDVPLGTRALWVALAACASLLLAATTTHISQNVAALPLVWIVPLVAYLLSFVVAFSTRTPPRWLMTNLAIVSLLASGFLLYRGVLNIPILPAAALFCVALFFLCLFLHSELYHGRPAPQHLTSFYFHVAAGGALGAVLIGVVAPVALPGNYDFAIGLLLTAGLGLVVAWPGGRVTRGVWSALLAGGIALIAIQVRSDRGVLVRVRNFYGTVYVSQAEEPKKASVRSLYHGVITHGRQVFRVDLRRVPSTYYSHESGLGLALDQCCHNRSRRIGVIGLGTGTIAVYGNTGDTLRFYEINRAVENIALSKFTYIGDSPAFMQIVRGDARVSLAAEPPQRYDVLVVDAFSGDAVPAHLITTQALEIYRRHLAPGGIVAFHVSNRFLALAPVVEQLARNAGMQAVRVTNPEDLSRDVFLSEWILVTANAEFLSNPAVVRARQPIDVPPGLRLWTDDYSSLFPIMKVSQQRF